MLTTQGIVMKLLVLHTIDLVVRIWYVVSLVVIELVDPPVNLIKPIESLVDLVDLIVGNRHTEYGVKGQQFQ